MTSKPKAAETEAAQAAYQNVRTRQKQTTTRRANPISFFLPINDRYRLTADERCWRIEQRRKDGEWRPIEFHPCLEAAKNSLSSRLLRTADVHCRADALLAAENIARTLTQALAPSFKVEKVGASRGSR